MPGLPTIHGFASILVAAAMFYGFASGKARVEIISLLTIGVIALGLYFFPLPGSAPQDGLALAFGGFGHHALITICALMILGRGLVVTGALDPAARALNRVWRFNRQLGLLVTLGLALTLSMVINDTPVMVLLLPILAYVWILAGMFLVGMPFLMRDAVTWLLAREGRWNLAVWSGILYGAVLLVLAVTTY